jgi:hypothetical protein
MTETNAWKRAVGKKKCCAQVRHDHYGKDFVLCKGAKFRSNIQHLGCAALGLSASYLARAEFAGVITKTNP